MDSSFRFTKILRYEVEKMKKISMVFAVGIVMFTLAGCVPGETVVTISACWLPPHLYKYGSTFCEDCDR